MKLLTLKNSIIGMLVIAWSIGCVLYTKNANSAQAKKQVHAYYASKDSKTLITEPVEWQVKLVYGDNPASRLVSHVAGYLGKYATRYESHGANSRDPQVVQKKIRHYETFYKDVLHPEEFYVPPHGFATFNDWFIRSFKDIETARPMEKDPRAIVSPADSKLLIIADLSQDTWVTIKEKRFNIEKFLHNKTLATLFEHGVMMIFRLAPYDYHRYHYPFDCMIEKEVYIHGLYHSVNPRAINIGSKPLTENKRSYELLTPVGIPGINEAMPIVMVQVGATAVASIVNEFMDYQKDILKDPNHLYKKGENMGYFQFGGSTIVLLFPQNSIIPDSRIVENSNNGYETAVKVRETVAVWKTAGS